jgi:hypothetical protein
MARTEKIPKDIQEALYRRSIGVCECTMRSCRNHPPGQRCTRRLLEWRAYQKVPGGSYLLRNLLAMCPQCEENARNLKPN